MLSPMQWALVALFGPLIVAAILVVIYPLRRAGKPAAILSVFAALLSLGAAVALFMEMMVNPDILIRETFQWLPSGTLAMATVGIHLDGISISMLFVVTLVAACVQIFSLDYMADEPDADFGRYFAYHSFFIFSMLLLVLAPNMLQFFAGWELVGLTSYLLIGFYYKKPSAGKAAVKAFWVTKFADMGLLIGLILLVAQTGSFEWTAQLDSFWPVAITGLFFIAVMGKSAQFPLHIWLPNAMEGPTPVSALLHAATMVAAGVYLVVRADPLFAQAIDTRIAMVWIGGFTALFAAVLATVQTDIKKVLAYSTCSQLGYMVCALGAGSMMGGYFHLTTHAFFKALLFLAAGSIIHAVHSNELKDMGGLFKKMPLTATVFIIGALALAGVPGLAGFFSKDLILEAVFQGGFVIPWIFLIIAAFLTAFYMGRVVFLAFFGVRSGAAENAHEPGWSMKLPLIILAIFSVGAGYAGGAYAEFWGQEYHFHLGMSGMIGTALGVSGIFASYYLYGSKSGLPKNSFVFFKPVGRLARSGQMDKLYESLFRNVALVVANGIGWFDRYVIDGLMNYIAWLSITAGQKLRKTQTGNVSDYVYVLAAGVVVVVCWGVWA